MPKVTLEQTGVWIDYDYDHVNQSGGAKNLSNDYGQLMAVYKEIASSLGISYQQVVDRVNSGETLEWEKPIS